MRKGNQLAVKTIVVGDSSVGKTTIVSRFLKKDFQTAHIKTVGVEFGKRTITINQNKVVLQIWDTAGQQQFKSITRSYYRSAAAALVVFDLTNQRSFENVNKWIEDVRGLCHEKICIILVGNKADLKQEQVVSSKQAQKLASKRNIFYIQTSAKIMKNIQQTFYRLAIMINKQLENGEVIPKEQYGIKIIPQKTNHKNQNCIFCP